MSVRKSFDHRLNAWLDEGPQVAPHDLLHAVLEEVPSVRQERRSLFVGPWRIPMLTFARLGVAAVAVAVVAAAVIVLRSGPSIGTGPTATLTPTATPTSIPTSTPTAIPTAAPTPVVFTSARYGYSITLPTGWVAHPAIATWDGTTAPIFNDPVVDAFGPIGDVGAFVSSAPTSSTLAAWVADGVATNARIHTADSGCSNIATPDSVTSITIGGQPGTLVGFKNCFFVNMAFTVVNGKGYRFAFRDPMTMNSPTITTMLESVVFP